MSSQSLFYISGAGCPLLQSLLGFPLVCTGGLVATVYFTITGTEYKAPACFHFSYTLAGGLTRINCPARKGTYWFRGKSNCSYLNLYYTNLVIMVCLTGILLS